MNRKAEAAAYYLKNKEHIKAKRRAYYAANPEKVRDRSGTYRERIRRKVFNFYGWSCAMCGFSDERALTLDHVNNDGAAERRSINGKNHGQASLIIYRNAIKDGFPSKYQTLCANCQFIKLKTSVRKTPVALPPWHFKLDSFIKAMRLKLQANNHKGGWDQYSLGALFQKLIEEVDELKAAIVNEPVENIALEAADIANYALMIADTARRNRQ